MNLKQSRAVQTLCSYLLGPLHAYDVFSVTPEEAREALALLADYAAAGWDGSLVRQRWDETKPILASKKPKRPRKGDFKL